MPFKKNIKKLILSHFLIIGFLLVSALFNGQNKNMGLPNIKNYQKTDYQSGTQNWCIDQDNNGNVYFANNNGLLQFDGTTWRNYNIPNTANIRSVKIDDSTGRIYVGGYSEFGYFKSDDNGNLTYVSLSKLISSVDSKLADFIWKIHIFNDEVIFQSFQMAYVFKNDTLKILQAPNRFQFSFQVENKLYFQDIASGIFQYENGILAPVKGTTFFNNSEIWGIFAIPKNRLLIATLEKGLFVYENGEVSVWKTEANVFIKKNSGLGGTINGQSVILNSVLDGMIICDFEGKIIQHINLKKGLQNNTILSSFIDNKNNLWLGLDNGISYININSPFTYFGSSHNLSTVYASVVHQDFLYVATNQGVFYHSLNRSFLDDTFTLVEGTTAQSWNIQVIDNELICSNNRGALIIDNNRVIKILDPIGYFGFKEVPNRPNIVIGSNYGGFAIFEKTKNGLVYKNQIAGFNQSSNSFELDDTYLWLHRDQILYKMEISDDLKTFNSIKAISNLTKTDRQINSLQKINGEVYFQSNNKFYTYSRGQDLFFEDKKISSLFKNTPVINSMTEDPKGNLWYTFDESLGLLMKNKNRDYTNIIEPFANLTGNMVINYLSVNTIGSKSFFIGLINGLALYDSEFLPMDADKPNVFIRSFSYGGHTFVQGNPQEKSRALSIPYKSNNVKFTFSSPEFENSESIQYSYQLYPFDKQWSNWSTLAVKEYTNLRENDYKMNVKVKNSYGIESDAAVFTFSILPPWYRHFLAYIFYLLLFLLSFYILSVVQKRILRKKQYYKTIEQRKLYLEKETKIRKEQYELEKEIEKLNRKQLQTKILAKDKELVSNSLQVVKKNKVLNGIINKLKDMDVETLNEDNKFQLSKLKKSIIKEVNTDKSWKHLEKHIKNVHFDFLKRLQEKYPDISPRELDLSTYLLLNMSTKEIAEIMNISNGGVELARYRLRKKLKLKRSENLTGFLMTI